MDHILTLVASAKLLDTAILAAIAQYCDSAGLTPAPAPHWLEPGKAANIALSRRPNLDQIRAMRAILAADRIDIFITPSRKPPIRLFLADMDATMIEGETLDSLAKLAGREAEIAAITAMAMGGAIDFTESLHRRMALLKGLEEGLLHRAYAAMRLSPGAKTLMDTLRQRDVVCVLVSGGFTFFTEKIAGIAGFNHHHGNQLDIENGVLTGRVAEPVLDHTAKLEILRHYQKALGLAAQDIMAMGDGANDLPMLEQAGFGIGYRPKPLLLEKLENVILYGGLDTVLYAQNLAAPSE